jgi:signal transduction histidine kinase
VDIKAESRALRRHTVFKAAITNSLGNFLTIIGSWVVIPNFEISFNFKVLAIIIGVFAAINFGFAITYNNKFPERKKRLYELFYNTFTVILDIAVGLLLVNQGREFGFLSPQHLATWLFVVASIESHASYLFHKPKFFLLVMTCLHLPSGIWLISYGTIEGYICAGLIFGYAPMIMDRILRLKELSDNTIDAIVDSQKQRQINEQSVRLANLGRMASGIAHEINNPLAIADGLAVILKTHIEKDIFDKSTAKDKLEKISASHERIKEVVLRMKGFNVDNSSRILENVNFYEIVETNLSFFAEKLNVHEITLRTENLDRKLSYPCNKEEITQIVLSFFTNAVDAIQESKDLERKEISIFSSSTRDSVTISVSDTGNTLEDSDEIFTPFYTTKEPGKGFGLGLSLAQYLANSYNGKIEGQRLDDRTIFTLTLPKV